MAQPEFSSIRLVTPADQASFNARNHGDDASRRSGRHPRGLADLLLARGHINQENWQPPSRLSVIKILALPIFCSRAG